MNYYDGVSDIAKIVVFDLKDTKQIKKIVELEICNYRSIIQIIVRE
jgi:hypothetical protein